jgi:hypothetical protein
VDQEFVPQGSIHVLSDKKLGLGPARRFFASLAVFSLAL